MDETRKVHEDIRISRQNAKKKKRCALFTFLHHLIVLFRKNVLQGFALLLEFTGLANT